VDDKEGSTTTVSFVIPRAVVNVGGGTTIGRKRRRVLNSHECALDGEWYLAAFSLGTGSAGRGHVIISGLNAIVNDTRQLSMAVRMALAENTLVVSNSASSLWAVRFAWAAIPPAGSSNNTLIVDGARMSLGSGHAVIGRREGVLRDLTTTPFLSRTAAVLIANNHSVGIAADDDAGPSNQQSPYHPRDRVVHSSLVLI